MKLSVFPHPSTYNLRHHLMYSLLPAPYRYTPTQSPGYWVNRNYGKSNITRLVEQLPFPLKKAVINNMYELDCLMVGPGALVMRTPRNDEFKSWFYRMDFEQIFGHPVLGVSSNFPLKFIPGSLVLATDVKVYDADWEPSQYTKDVWTKLSKPPWVVKP